MIVVEGGSRAAAPKGSMTYAFTHIGDFLLLLLLLLLLFGRILQNLAEIDGFCQKLAKYGGISQNWAEFGRI